MRTREGLTGSAAETFHREGLAVASLFVLGAQAAVSGGALRFPFAGKAAPADAVESAVPGRSRIIAKVASRKGRAGSSAWSV